MKDEILARTHDRGEVADGVQIDLAVRQLSSEWRARHQNRSVLEKLPCFKPRRAVETFRGFRLDRTRSISDERSLGGTVGRPAIAALRGIALDRRSGTIPIHRDDLVQVLLVPPRINDAPAGKELRREACRFLR